MEDLKATENKNISDKGKKHILIFTATYNESENILKLVNDIQSIISDADVLIIDDNSPDGTGMLLNKIAANNSYLKIIHRPAKLGLGTAHHLAMIYAIRNNYDILVTMDADHSHDPQDIPKLLSKLEEADFVIGSRHMKGGACDYRGMRRFVSLVASILPRYLLGIDLHEFTTSYRAFRVNKLLNVNFAKMHNQGYSFFMESIFCLSQANLRITEVPIHFKNRNTGVSKIPQFEIVRGISKLFHLTASRIMYRKQSLVSKQIDGKCMNCGSRYLSGLSSRSPNNSQCNDNMSAFRYLSMAHKRKPLVAKCLQCGRSQALNSIHGKSFEC